MRTSPLGTSAWPTASSIRAPWQLRASDLALLLVAVVWGTRYGVAKGALAFYPVLGFLAVRFLLAAVLLAPACRWAPPCCAPSRCAPPAASRAATQGRQWRR